jgi:hypothetical protein
MIHRPVRRKVGYAGNALLALLWLFALVVVIGVFRLKAREPELGLFWDGRGLWGLGVLSWVAILFLSHGVAMTISTLRAIGCIEEARFGRRHEIGPEPRPSGDRESTTSRLTPVRPGDRNGGADRDDRCRAHAGPLGELQLLPGSRGG